MSKEEIRAYHKALAAVIAEATRLHNAGVPVDDAVKQANWGEYASWTLASSQGPIADPQGLRRAERTDDSGTARRRRCRPSPMSIEQPRTSRRRRAPHARRHVAHRRRSAPAPRCSSSARTCSAPAPSSSAAPTTRCRGSRADERRRGVVTFSSGNHAQAIALAGQVLDIPRVIVMPSDAPAVKRTPPKATAARSSSTTATAKTAKRSASGSSRERGLTLVPPYDHPHIIAGQGTAARELFEEVGALDFLFVPCGGGGLLSGSALAAQRAGARLPRDRRRARGRRRCDAIVPDEDAADGRTTRRRSPTARARRRSARSLSRSSCSTSAT